MKKFKKRKFNFGFLEVSATVGRALASPYSDTAHNRFMKKPVNNISAVHNRFIKRYVNNISTVNDQDHGPITIQMPVYMSSLNKKGNIYTQ